MKLNPTSAKTIIDKSVVIDIKVQVIIYVPFTPSFLPHKPGIKALIKGK